MGRTAGSGFGSVYKRGNKWRGQVVIDGERYSFTADKKADVNNWLAKVRTDANLGLLPKKSDITVKEFSKIWLDRKVEPSVKPQTYNLYVTAVDRHINPMFGDVKLQDLNRNMIEEAYRSEFSDLSAEYASALMKRFKAMLKYAMELNLLARNPHEYVTYKSNPKTSKVRAYTDDEQKALINYLKGNLNVDNSILYLLLTTGMRVGEALALNVEDYDSKSKSINISKTVVRLKEGYIVQDNPKTDSSTRTIYLSDNTAKYLNSYLKKYKPKGMMFTIKGNIISHFRVIDKLEQACDKCGVEYRSVHALRHTWATRALEKGIDIKTVSTLLGHKSVLTTMNTYQDVFASQKIKAAKIMNDLF